MVRILSPASMAKGPGQRSSIVQPHLWAASSCEKGPSRPSTSITDSGVTDRSTASVPLQRRHFFNLPKVHCGWRAWTGLGAAVTPVTPRHFCVAGVALGDIHLDFTWHAVWHNLTSMTPAVDHDYIPGMITSHRACRKSSQNLRLRMPRNQGRSPSGSPWSHLSGRCA